MKNKNTQKSRFTVWGYLGFFAMVVVIASLSILVYDFTEEKSGGNTALSALVTLANICVMTVLCTAIDAVRRKVMVERPVKRILDATERITAGDFSVRIGRFTPGENTTNTTSLPKISIKWRRSFQKAKSSAAILSPTFRTK